MGSESIGAVILSKSSSSSEEKVFPPGFRFHPTDEELILYYLKRKICGRSLKLDIVGEVDVYKWDPEELPGQSKWKTGDRQWFFFSPRDRKYATGARSNRATMHGYWKATGKDRTINCNSRVVGLKKTLVYYHGRAPSGQRTDWVMHEYTLDEDELKKCKLVQEYYALYKLFKKSGPGPKNGEQYGAPFVEEEWADDYEYMVQNINTLVNEPKSMVESDIVPPVDQINLVNVEDIDHGIPLGLGPSSGLDLDQSANEPSVITSVEEMNPLFVNENFLELDDLIGPQPVFQKSEMPLLADFDEFSLFDLYNDSTTFNGTNLFESQQLSNLEFESYLNETRSEAVINNEDFTNAQATDVTISATSGVITNEKLENPDLGVNQCRGFGEDDGSGSWFSSALWAFVESVSARPASAVEGGSLVNKEFSRINNANGGGGVECTLVTRRVKRSSRSSSRGSIVFFSILGILFSILWVFVGTSIELLGRCLLR